MRLLLGLCLLLIASAIKLDLDVEYSNSVCKPGSNGECTYTKDDLASDWAPRSGGLAPWYEQNDDHSYVVSNPRPDTIGNGSRSLREFYPADLLVSASGDGWKVGLTPRETYMSMYNVYFPDGTENAVDRSKNERVSCFNFQCGGKLPGQCGGPCSGYPSDCTKEEWEHQGCNTGGNQPVPCSQGGGGAQGWSARTMFREFGIAVTYLYGAGAKASDGYGVDIVWQSPESENKCVKSATEQPVSRFNPNDLVTFTRGRWQQLTERISMNTVTGGNANEDGELQVWLDGQLVVNCTDLVFRCTDNVYINKFYFSTFFGGKEDFFEPGSDQHAYFDDFYGSGDPMYSMLVQMDQKTWQQRHAFPNPSPCPGLQSLECNKTGPGPNGAPQAPIPPPPPSTPSAPMPPQPSCVQAFGQCGGKKWNGPTNCCPGLTCVVKNPYYSDCASSADDGSSLP